MLAVVIIVTITSEAFISPWAPDRDRFISDMQDAPLRTSTYIGGVPESGDARPQAGEHLGVKGGQP